MYSVFLFCLLIFNRSVWFCGHSAGAQLVAMLLLSGWLDQLDDSIFRLVKGFVLISGVYNLTPLVNTYINDALKLSRRVLYHVVTFIVR